MAVGEPPVILKEETPELDISLGSDDPSSVDSSHDDSSAPTSDPAAIYSDDTTEAFLDLDMQPDRWHVFMIVSNVALDSVKAFL